MINVLYINPVAQYGGAEFSLQLFFKHMDRNHICPHVLFFQDGPFVTWCQDQGIRTLVVPFSGANVLQKARLNLSKFLCRVCDMVKYIKDNKIALVHSNAYFSAYLAGVLGKLANIPSVSHQRDVTTRKLRPVQMGLQCVDRVIAVSNFIKNNLLERVPELRVDVVYNGVEMPRNVRAKPYSKIRMSYNISSDAICIGFVGMMYPCKGPDLLIAAARKVLRKVGDRDVHFLFIGDCVINTSHAEFLVYLKKEAARLRVVDRVHFTGWVADKEEIFNAIDVLVHPSRIHDSFPRSVIEAMAYGVPVIGSYRGGIPEQVQDLILLFCPDNVDEISRMLCRLIMDPEERHRVGSVLQKKAKDKFSILQYVNGIYNVYGKLGIFVKIRPGDECMGCLDDLLCGSVSVFDYRFLEAKFNVRQVNVFPEKVAVARESQPAMAALQLKFNVRTKARKDHHEFLFYLLDRHKRHDHWAAEFAIDYPDIDYVLNVQTGFVKSLIDFANLKTVYTLNGQAIIIPGLLKPADKSLLMNVMHNLPNWGHVVEVGRFYGYSTVLMDMALRHKDRVNIISVDWSAAGSYRKQHFLSKWTFSRRVSYLDKRTEDAVADIKGLPVTALFYDVNGQYGQTRQNLAAYLPLVKPGGYVICHNYGASPGVTKAIYKVLLGPQIGRVVQHKGQTIVIKKKGTLQEV